MYDQGAGPALVSANKRLASRGFAERDQEAGGIARDLVVGGLQRYVLAQAG
jgi:hypothetical protein